MEFGEFPLSKAKGGILAHSIRLPDNSFLKKGTSLDDAVIKQLENAQIETVVIARLEARDINENEAANRIAKLFSGEHARLDGAKTGRVNLFAQTNGLLNVDGSLIDAINAADPGITVATLNNDSDVNEGRMIATVKIIPYGIRETVIESIEKQVTRAPLELKPYRAKRIGLVSTRLSGTKEKLLDKTRQVLERRLQPSGSSISFERRISHSQSDLEQVMKEVQSQCDILIVFGASAISDVRDVIPAALVACGGDLVRFGMPVDPGNLLLLGRLGELPVIGAPGCARGVAENGFDWVLHQILAGSPVEEINIVGMGVGGLLMETGARPHPRLGKSETANKQVGIILAAGQSRRMGEANKMSVEVNGKPMVRHVAEAALQSELNEVIVVTGHQPQAVEQALDGLQVRLVHNGDYQAGLSSSLATGISALGGRSGAAMIMLGDMPFITSAMINRLLEQGADMPERIVMATHEGKRGNPVLWPRRFFEALTQIEGDTGARHIVAANGDQVVEVELGKAASLDLDTPEAVRAILQSPD